MFLLVNVNCYLIQPKYYSTTKTNHKKETVGTPKLHFIYIKKDLLQVLTNSDVLSSMALSLKINIVC